MVYCVMRMLDYVQRRRHSVNSNHQEQNFGEYYNND